MEVIHLLRHGQCEFVCVCVFVTNGWDVLFSYSPKKQTHSTSPSFGSCFFFPAAVEVKEKTAEMRAVKCGAVKTWLRTGFFFVILSTVVRNQGV